MKIISTLLLCLSFQLALYADGKAFTIIAGDLPRLITSDKSPYIVTADVFVSAGKTVTIEPGTVLLFRNFTGLHVQGTLEVKGNRSAPVVFTTENDPAYNPKAEHNPTPFDWNGIYIHKDGFGSDLAYVFITYSVKGVVSETRFLKIDNAVFKENGRSNLTIEGEEKEVVGEQPFSYSVSVKDAKIDGISVKILKDPDAPRRNLVRYSSLGALVIGGAVGSIFVNQYRASAKELDFYSSRGQENLTPNSSDSWDDKKKIRDLNLIGMSGGFLVAALGAIGFTYSFTF